MQRYPLVRIKDSIAVKLLKVVFFVYLGVMALATVTHITVEYYHVKTDIIEELETFKNTFKPELTEIVWSLEWDRLKAFIIGMLEIPHIIGVKVEERNTGEIVALGTIIDQQGKTVAVDRHGQQTPVREKGVFWVKFPLVYLSEVRELEIGEATIYSGSTVIFQRVKLGIMVLIINEIIKMTVVWLIFIWVGRMVLSRPLASLTRAAEQIELDNLENLHVDANTSGRNELKILEEAFNSMIQKLNASIEQRRQAEKLKRAKETAEAANKAKSDFLASMSHELRTPLNAILGFSRLMDRSQSLNSEQRENLGIIRRSGEHLLTLINDVLDLSKIEAGRITLNVTNFDLYCVFDDLEDMFRLRTEEKHLQLIFERHPDVPQYVNTDEVRLRQVLINLLNNAVKFTEKGGVTVRVRQLNIDDCRLKIEERGPGEKNSQYSPSASLRTGIVNIHFEIEDTGPGIGSDELDTLFDAFVQAQTGRKTHEGTGLGLAISRKFVQLMGGDIHVKSDMGHGATFMFHVQVGLVDPATIAHRPATISKRVVALEPEQPTYRILVVDDRWTNRQLLAKLLVSLGFDVQEACNGQEALDIWDRWEPHLIWMDMRMPVMDGYEATRQIKSTIKGQATAVIALTASVLEEERAVVLSAGCDDFVRKPFREEDLFGMMHKHLGVRYVYEEGEEQASDEGQTTEDVLTPDALASLPAALLVDLEQAVTRVNMDLITTTLESLRSHNAALADTLAHLIDNFEYHKILTVLQEAGEHR